MRATKAKEAVDKAALASAQYKKDAIVIGLLEAIKLATKRGETSLTREFYKPLEEYELRKLIKFGYTVDCELAYPDAAELAFNISMGFAEPNRPSIKYTIDWSKPKSTVVAWFNYYFRTYFVQTYEEWEKAINER